MKTCKKCGLEKSESEFHKRADTKSGYTSHCAACRNQTRNALFESDPALKEHDRKRSLAKTPQQRRDAQIKHKYGITRDEYETMLVEQNGVCAICHEPETLNTKLLSVDHDHETNKVRALLCHYCNAGIGYFKDDPAKLLSAVAYLKHHKEPITCLC